MSTQPWGLGPVWTTVDRVKGISPEITRVARSIVSKADPPDLEVAADDFIAACVVQAQGYIVGTLLHITPGGPSGIPMTFEDTPDDLIRYTTDRTIVEIYNAGTAQQMPPNVERKKTEVGEWLAGLVSGDRFIATAAPEDEGASSTPPRRTAPTGTARSPVGAAARRLLPVPGQPGGGCW